MPTGPADSKTLAAALRASQTIDLAEFLEACAAGIGELTSAERVHAYVRTAGENDLELRASWPGRRKGAARAPGHLDADVMSLAAGGGAQVDARKLAAGNTHWAGGEGGQVALLPIRSGKDDEPLGVFLAVGAARDSSIPGSDMTTAREFLRLVEPALGNIRLVGELRETAVRDDIAGCYNRRHFETFMGEEIARARRFHSQVSILFLDMDNLKSVNTAFGHAMGSRSLQEASARIAGGIRKIDKLFRFGGDEFCIVLPETDTGGAFEVAERTRQSIAGAPFLVSEVGGVPLSASLGVATFPDHGLGAEELVQAADRAMQNVKKTGKNAIGIAETVSGTPARRRTAGKSGKETL